MLAHAQSCSYSSSCGRVGRVIYYSGLPRCAVSSRRTKRQPCRLQGTPCKVITDAIARQEMDNWTSFRLQLAIKSADDSWVLDAVAPPSQTSGLSQQLAEVVQKSVDFTATARHHAGIVQADDLVRVSQVLSSPRGQPLLIGETGVPMFALMEALAAQIREGHTPLLKDVHLVGVDLQPLVLGSLVSSDLVLGIRAVVATYQREGKGVVLFVDDVDKLIRAGESNCELDVVEVLSGMMEGDELRCVFASTPHGYRRVIQPRVYGSYPSGSIFADKFVGLLTKVPVTSLGPSSAAGALHAFKDILERRYRVSVGEEDITAAVHIGTHNLTPAWQVLEATCRSRRAQLDGI